VCNSREGLQFRVRSTKAVHLAFNQSAMVRFHPDPPQVWTVGWCQPREGVSVRLGPHPPPLERKPVENRVRLESATYPQGYLWRQQCAPPKFGLTAGAVVGLQNRPCQVRVLVGPPIYSGVGCWHPGQALNLRARWFDSIRLSHSDQRSRYRYCIWPLTPDIVGSSPTR
jgi:hypothetical protein